MKTLRIFISSPGDVSEERDKAKQVIAMLQRDYGDEVALKPVLWEDMPLGADMSFQQGIDYVLSKDRGVDIAVFILWSRLGSPLGAAITKSDGSPYLSGTEREFDMMLEARRQSGADHPFILAYVRLDDDGFKRRLLGISPDKLPEEVNQQRLAREFITECFHDAQTQANLRAYHSYPEPVTFAGRLRQHLRELIETRLGDAALLTPRWEGEPYRAFDVFDIEHSDIFHGRDAAVADLEALFRRRAHLPFVVVIGASGSGKSSFVRAGLAASLIRFNLDDTVSRWSTVLLIPGECDGQVLHGLARALCDGLPGLRERHLTPEILAPRLSLEVPDIADVNIAFQQAGQAKTKVLLLVDQLEELYTDRRLTPEKRHSFYRALHALGRSGRFWIVATLRSDFYALAQRDPGFLALKGGDGQFDLLPPEASALRRMITEPARLAGLTFEKDERSGRTLDQLLLDDAIAQAEALPLLEFTLHELYQRREGRQLTLSSYRCELGNLAGAVGKRADAVFAALASDAQVALPLLLQRLITLNPSEGFTAVRRRTSYDPADSESPEGRLITTLVKARLLTASHSQDRSTLTFAHEALLTSWDKIAGWIKQNHAHLRLRTGVEQFQNRWQTANQDSSLLLPSGLPLEEGRKLAFEAPHLLPPETAAYIQASITHAEEKKRRLRGIRMAVFVSLTLLCLLASGTAVWAVLKQQEAEKQKKIAQQEAQRADGELAKANHQAERSKFEEGLAWLERARSASDSGDHIAALLLAGRAVGFKGYGRTDEVTEPAKAKETYPLLLGQSFKTDPDLEHRRQSEAMNVQELVNSTYPTLLPLWSSPATGHHQLTVTSLAFNPGGSLVISGAGNDNFVGEVKLWDALTGQVLKILEGHKHGITCVACSPDGSRIASASNDNTVRLWDVATGKLIATLEDHSDAVTSVAFSPDGKCLASGSKDTTIRLWDAISATPLKTLEGHNDAVTDIKFRPDGAIFVSASTDKTVKLWDAKTHILLNTIEGHESGVESAAFSPDGKLLAIGFSERVKLYETVSRKPLHTLRQPHGYVNQVAFCPDGSVLASSSYDAVNFWETASGTLIHTLEVDGPIAAVAFSPDGSRFVTGVSRRLMFWDANNYSLLNPPAGHTKGVSCVAFSPDDSILASGSRDHAIQLWNADTGRLLDTLRGHQSPVSSVAFSPGGKVLASGSYDDTVKLWEIRSGKPILTMKGHESSVTSVAFRPDGRRLVSGSDDETVRLWDTTTGEALLKLAGHEEAVTSVAFSPDGLRVASGSEDKTVRLWDAHSGKLLLTLEGHVEEVTSVVFTPDGSVVISGSEDATVKLWDAATGKPLETRLRYADSVNNIAISLDGNRLACGVDDWKARLWDPTANKSIQTPEWHTGYVNSVAFSNDGSRLVTSSDDATIKLWSIDSGHLLRSLGGNEQLVGSMVFSPDGSVLLTGSRDKTVKFWDVDSGKLLSLREGHTKSVEGVAFSPDGSRAASASSDSTVKIWDAVSGKLLSTLEGDALDSVAFSLDGHEIICGSDNNVASIWNTASGKLVMTLKGHAKKVTDAVFSPDGQCVGSGSDDNTVKIWDRRSGKVLHTLESHTSPITDVAFNPDGSLLASGSFDQTINIWETKSGRLTRTLEGRNSVLALAFSPDGTRIAAGLFDGTIKLWEAVSGKLIMSLKAHRDIVASIAFRPDGLVLASSSGDGVKLWDLKQEIDLIQYQDLFRLKGTEVVSDTIRANPNLFADVIFPRFGPRHDEFGQLSNAGLNATSRAFLLLRRLTRSGQWREAMSFWKDLRTSDPMLPDKPGFQRQYLILLLNGAFPLAYDDPFNELQQLLPEITQNMSKEALKDPLTALPLFFLLDLLDDAKQAAIAQHHQAFRAAIHARMPELAPEQQPSVKN